MRVTFPRRVRKFAGRQIPKIWSRLKRVEEIPELARARQAPPWNRRKHDGK